jgi:hypothetical protein
MSQVPGFNARQDQSFFGSVLGVRKENIWSMELEIISGILRGKSYSPIESSDIGKSYIES